ncbi:ErmE/ErmH/ErmO/ErmR family 23S rRNA (adenine(2058)-N(6))-methyltransferase [Yinghuangia sp. YIM S09857]|uniref:ErmE/ErmH/ErmO/ErmR family 23S rRNA (adenine(2058)-N(6))-methyltransferase n=1 Tax=Yinghuangia sp. YIM S09857 TaxID=3436929 RepID=UPI003F531511
MARTSTRDRLRRELSQNFLSRDAARRFVRVAHPAPGALVLEVGAGRGAVTAELARVSGAVVAYELDPRHAAFLRRRFADGPHRVSVVRGDFVAARDPARPFEVVANVPFSRTSDVVAWCLAARHLTRATLVTQWEYARKRTGGYGRWTLRTIRTWPTYAWSLAGRIPRAEFRPEPRVDAGILRLTRRPAPLLPSQVLSVYEELVDIGFTGRGGSLHASLRRHLPRPVLDRAFARGGIEPSAVVGDVTPDQWIRLAEEVFD